MPAALSQRLALVACLAAALPAGCGSPSDPAALIAEADALAARRTRQGTEAAIERYVAATGLFNARRHHLNAARAGQKAGIAYQQLGALARSAGVLREAREHARLSGDAALESAIGSDLGTAESLIAESASAFDAARASCAEGRALAERRALASQLARALRCHGDVEYYQQQSDAALDFYKASREIVLTLNDPTALAENDLLLGNVYSDLARFALARESLDRAATFYEQSRDTRQYAIAEVGLGRLHTRLGEFHEALTRFESSLPVLREMGDALWEASSLTGLAEVQMAVGDTASGVRSWGLAYEMFDRIGLHTVAIDILMSIGKSELATGRVEQALTRFQRALDAADRLGSDRWKAFAVRYMGVARLAQGQTRAARELLERALVLQAQLGDQAGYRLEAQARTELGEIERLLGNHDAAEASLSRSLALSRAANDRASQVSALYTLARSALDRGDLRHARARIEEALDLAESLRSDVLHRDLRASYVASIYRTYELQVEILMQVAARGSETASREAFEASERSRVRSLLDGIADREVDLIKGVSPALLERAEAINQQMRDWNARHASALTMPQKQALADEYVRLESRYNQVQAEIRRNSPAYAARTPTQLPRTADIQRALLDDGTLLLEFFLGDARSYFWAVSSSGLRSITLPPRHEIEPLALELYRLSTRADGARQTAESVRDYQTKAARLSEILLGAVDLSRATRLLIVADGALHYLPFAALPAPRASDPTPLIDRYEIVSLPSATAILANRRSPRRADAVPRRVAVLADPVFEPTDSRIKRRTAVRTQGPTDLGTQGPALTRLLGTRGEADAILRAAGGSGHLLAVDFEASRVTALRPDLATYPIVHFATHGVLDNTNPGASGIVLSRFDREGRPQNGFLRLPEISRMTLPVDLVVLSACETAMGQPIRGEGLVGMVRGFMHAGARRVIASQWRVDDDATRALMRLFYTELLQNGRPPAAALREAQRAMRQNDAWRDPFYWAAFVLQGDWR